MLHRHDEAFTVVTGNLETFGQVFFFHNPRVVASHLESSGQTFKKFRFISGECNRGGNTVQHLVHVVQFAAKSFADGLVPQANSQHAFLWPEFFDNIQQQSGFFGNSGAWRQNNFVVLFKVAERNFVVSENIHRQASYFFDGVHQVVSKRIVIIDNHYFHIHLFFDVISTSMRGEILRFKQISHLRSSESK